MSKELIDDIKEMRKALCDIEEMARNSTTFPENLDDYYKIRGVAGSAWQWSVIALGDDNELDMALTQQQQAAEPVGVVNIADCQSPSSLFDPETPLRMAVEETAPRSIQGLPKGTKLYLHPPKPAAHPVSVATRDRVMDAVADALGNAYDCCRVWEAWSYGTMGQDDFELVSNDINRLAEIADAAIGAMAAQPQVPEAIREIASWLDTEAADFCGGPSFHEAEIIGMEISGPIDSSSANKCMRVARKVLLAAASVWEQHALSAAKEEGK